MTPPRSGSPHPRGWLELGRVFLAPSAMADSYAGLCLASLQDGQVPTVASILGVAALSVAAYCFGMTTNDIFDAARDRSTFPHRPLPSGRVSLLEAWTLAGLLAGTALALSVPLGVTPWVATLLVVAVLYNAGGKAVPIVGSLLMGSARGLNLILGAAAVVGSHEVLDCPRVLTGAAVLGLFVFGVTSVSRLEERPFDRGALRLLAIPVFLAPLALVLSRPTDPALWVQLALVLILLGAGLRAAWSPPLGVHGASRFVGRALGVIPLLDAAILIGLSRVQPTPLPVGVLYLLYCVAFLWRRGRALTGLDES